MGSWSARWRSRRSEEWVVEELVVESFDLRAIAGRVDGVEHAYLHGTVCMHGRRQAGTSRERMRIVLARTYSSCEACEDWAERTRMACAIQRVARRMVA
jgi:hypothetical protein